MSCIDEEISTRIKEMSPDVGFIIIRHVIDEITNQYWQECYMCIRKLYSNDKYIIMIDDHSDPAYVSKTVEFELENIVFIMSGVDKGRGEFLPYLYYAKHKWFDRAVIMHDAVFIKRKIPLFTNTKQSYRFLWSFPLDGEYVDNERTMLSALRNNKHVLEFHKFKRNELKSGCFGCMSIVHHNFLRHIDSIHSLERMTPFIKNRYDRMTFERVIAILFQFYHNYNNNSLFGNIFTYGDWGHTLEDYRNNVQGYLPFYKVWTGR